MTGTSCLDFNIKLLGILKDKNTVCRCLASIIIRVRYGRAVGIIKQGLKNKQTIINTLKSNEKSRQQTRIHR